MALATAVSGSTTFQVRAPRLLSLALVELLGSALRIDAGRGALRRV
jgi:hypothetical protein